jgi:hypothetical protein
MSPHDDDDARDPHLREALRHAPDAQLQAPAALGEFILNEARAKARDPRAAVPDATPRWAVRLWAWLARPAVATGFAGVMAATLVGLMWWDQPMDEALPRHPASAQAPAPERPASALGPAVPAAPAVTPQAPVQADRAATRTAPVRKPATAATAGAGAEPALATPAPQAPPAPAAAPPAPSAEANADALLAQAEEQKRERSSIAPAEATSRRAAAKAQLNESRLQREGEAYARVASVRATIAGEPSRWAWQRANAASQPMNDAVDTWLAELDASAGAGWQPRSGRETAAPRGRALALLRDGQVQHSFQLTERGVLWLRGHTAWHAELPAEALATLQAALDSAAP